MIAEHDLARRGCQILADHEIRRPRHLYIASLKIRQKIVESPQQTFAARLHGFLHRRRVGRQKIRGCRGVKPLAPPERRPAAVAAGQARRVIEHVLHLAGDHQVPLFHNIPACRVAPDRIGEACIVGIRRYHILARHAQCPVPGMRLQLPQPACEVCQSLGHFLRMGQPCQLRVYQGSCNPDRVDLGLNGLIDCTPRGLGSRRCFGLLHRAHDHSFHFTRAAQAPAAALLLFCPMPGAYSSGCY